MNELVRIYNDGELNFEVEFKMINGEIYAKANTMCDRVKLDNWKRSANTKRYVDALKSRAINDTLNSRNIEYIISEKGVDTINGTFIHEKLIINLARFISVEFELWCDEQIAELINKKNKIPTTMREVLEIALAQQDRIDKLEIETTLQKEEIALNEPKVELYNVAMSSDNVLDMKQVAGIIGIKGLGRNKLFELLREEKILNNYNLPYQNFINSGYFKIIEIVSKDRVGEPRITPKTVVFQKGVDYILKLIKKLGL